MSQTALFCEKPNHFVSEYEFLQDPKDKNAKLGVGSFATVKLARERKTSKPIALKMVDLDNSKSKAADLHNLRTEVFIHRRIDHPNIIKYHGYMQEAHCIYIILDYAEKGNLYSYIHKRKSLTPQEVFRFFHQTCLAVQYLHRHDVMHRDIKPENLLLDKDLNIKLCDFGWAAERIKEKRTTFCGTYEYMAPEIVHKRPYDYRVDIWSLGILLYELIHREAPYKGRSLSEIWNSFSKGIVTYSSNMDPQAKDLIQRILKIQPGDRPSIAQILSHPYVKQHAEPEVKEHPGSAYASVRKEKADKENHHERLVSQEHTERPMTSADSTHKKPRKLSGFQPLNPQPVEAISKRKATEEQNSEHSGRTHTKSSSSLAKHILETLENDDKKVLQEQQPRKKRMPDSKGLSPNLKRSLQSIVSPPNRITPPDQVLSEVLGNNGGLSSISNLLENFSAYGSSSVKGTSQITGHNSVTSATLLGRIGTPSTMTHSATTSNSHTPVIPDNFRAFAPGRKVRTLTTSHTPTNSRPFFGPNTSIPHTTTTTRAPSHQKTLTVINETGLPRRMATESHGSASTRAIYKGNRHLISPRVFETSVSNYESVKELSKDIGSLVSPVGWTRRKLVQKGNSEISDVSKDEAGLKSFGNYESVMNSRPQLEKGNSSQDKEGFVPVINFEKFVKGGDYRPKTVMKGKENGNASLLRAQAIFAKKMKGHNKENKSEDERKMKNMLSLQKLYTPRDIQIQWNN